MCMSRYEIFPEQYALKQMTESSLASLTADQERLKIVFMVNFLCLLNLC